MGNARGIDRKRIETHVDHNAHVDAREKVEAKENADVAAKKIASKLLDATETKVAKVEPVVVARAPAAANALAAGIAPSKSASVDPAVMTLSFGADALVNEPSHWLIAASTLTPRPRLS
jgi:hypothetical protein